MGILTADMKRVIEEQKLGFVATVSADGSPSLSPKGTMRALDDEHIIFGEIRSPNTIENLRANPVMEINFVDPLSRTGYRFKGQATIVEKESEEFAGLFPHFDPWGDLATRINRIVKLRVERALAITSPAYDLGTTEETLRENWMAHFAALDRAARARRKKP